VIEAASRRGVGWRVMVSLVPPAVTCVGMSLLLLPLTGN